MSSIAPSLPVPVAPPDVVIFAEKHGVGEYLPAVLAMTRRIFPHWPINVYLEEDLEIANDWYIIVEVRIPDEAESEKVAELHRQWGGELFKVCPKTHVGLFLFGMA